MISFDQPVWLGLLIPLLGLLWWWRMPTRWLVGMRGAVIVLAVLAMAGLSIELPGRAGRVVVLVDRSGSMPEHGDVQARELIDALDAEKPAAGEVAVVSFGSSPAVETPPGGVFGGFDAAVGREASDYGGAIRTALSLIGEGPGRIVLAGDGRWTGRSPDEAAARAAARSIPLDYHLIERPTTNDLAIASLRGPRAVHPGEGFLVWATVHAPLPGEVDYVLWRGATVIARGRRHLSAGANRLVFRDRSEAPGVHRYRLDVRPAADAAGDTGEGATSATAADPMPQNNRAKLLVGVTGPKPILHLAPKAETSLGELLRAGQLNVETRGPGELNEPISLELLSGYAAVLLENVPSQRLRADGMRTLAAWVKETGAGVMMTGGKRSFGPGGYYRSPLEPIMPVSMERRREHRKFSVAIVVALDRSGSMAAPVPGGKTKMDLANRGAIEVLGNLTGRDQFGVIAVDSSPHTIVDLGSAGDAEQIADRVRRIASQGGGIFVYEALRRSVEMISRSDRNTRHIVLFADARDSEQPGQYKDLLREATGAGVTFSVIGLGSDKDVDADLLRDIAKRGNGRVFFTEQAEQLPRLFAQDTFVVTRSSFVEEPTGVAFTGALNALTGRSFELDRPIGGYSLTYLRDDAELAARTTDEHAAPVVASWHVGAGRALAYTGEASGAAGRPLADWPQVGRFFNSLARWTAGESQALPGGAMISQREDEGLVRVSLHLDPDREAEPFERRPTVSVLRGRGGDAPATGPSRAMRWVGPDELRAEFQLTGDETAIATVRLGDAAVSMPPTTLAYAPEYRPTGPGRGDAALASLARATGGRSVRLGGEVWDAIDPAPRHVRLAPWLLLAAVTLFLAEVFERRSGLLSTPRPRTARAAVERERAAPGRSRPLTTMLRRLRRAPDQADAPPDAGEPSGAKGDGKRKPPSPSPGESQPSEPSREPPAKAPTMADAMKAARDRAHNRTGGDRR